MKTAKAFTLVELLVVIAFIAILATIAIVVLGNARKTQRDAIRLSDLNELHTQLEIYFINNSAYPLAEAPVTLGAGSTRCLNADGFQPAGCDAPFLTSVPRDPTNNAYIYQSVDGSTYVIAGRLEGNIDGLSGQVRVTPAGIQ